MSVFTGCRLKDTRFQPSTRSRLALCAPRMVTLTVMVSVPPLPSDTWTTRLSLPT